MNNFNFISNLLANTKYDNNRVNEAILAFTDGDTDNFLRIMQYITGSVDMPAISETANFGAYIANLKEFNFFKNRVLYVYLQSRTFKVTADIADKFRGVKYDYYYDIPREIRNNNGDIELEVEYCDADSCSIDEWLQNSKYC